MFSEAIVVRTKRLVEDFLRTEAAVAVGVGVGADMNRAERFANVGCAASYEFAAASWLPRNYPFGLVQSATSVGAIRRERVLVRSIATF